MGRFSIHIYNYFYFYSIEVNMMCETADVAVMGDVVVLAIAEMHIVNDVLRLTQNEI